MALANFSLPFGGLTTTNWAATISPLQPHHATAVNNLLYGPAGHQESDILQHQDYFKNNPYAPPQNHQFRPKTNNNYLPPPVPSARRPHHQQQHHHQQQQQVHQISIQHRQSQSAVSTISSGPSTLQQKIQQQHEQQIFGQHAGSSGGIGGYNPPQGQLPPQTDTLSHTSRTYGENSYSELPGRGNTNQNGAQFFSAFNTQQRTQFGTQQTITVQPPTVPTRTITIEDQSGSGGPGTDTKSSGGPNLEDDQGYPIRPPGFTRVQAGQGSRTQIHAVLDYDADENDEEDYYDENDPGSPIRTGDRKSMPTVTPIQGPIFVKNGTVPVVPLFSYPTINNGTLVQIPIWWTALSVALGLDIRGDIIRGVPCVKRYHQLFCPTAGNSYPIDKIERFIDDNKALMRRMYGDFEMTTQYGPPLQQNKKRKRSTDEPDDIDLMQALGMLQHPIDDVEPGESYFAKLRQKRQSSQSFRGSGSGAAGSQSAGASGQNAQQRNQKPPGRAGSQPGNANAGSSTGRVDACESKVEIVTPYWASNSAGKIRAIVNTQHFEQAIHQEICTKVQTSRCGNDCGCEQKYKWHRLLAYDPDNDCKGIFMDWFLFPSCCVCRCNP